MFVLHKCQFTNIYAAHHLDTGFSNRNSSRLLFQFRTSYSVLPFVLHYFVLNIQFSDIRRTVDVSGPRTLSLVRK